MRNTFVNTIINHCKKNDDIFVISGDAGLGVFDDFKEDFADRFFNSGVAEQNMIGMASGMAISGKKVYVYNIIPFVLYRCYEQVRNDICYQELPVTLLGIGSGLTYSPQGMTHYSVEDVGLAKTLPNMAVFSPCDPVEAELAANYSVTCETPMYVRMAKRGEPELHKKKDFDITAPQVMRDGGDFALIFHGSIGEEVLKSAEILAAQGINAKVISVPMVQPLNMEILLDVIGGIKKAAVVEEHFIGTGLGASICTQAVIKGADLEVTLLGIKDEMIHHIKKQPGMRDHYGISGTKIAEFVKAKLRG